MNAYLIASYAQVVFIMVLTGWAVFGMLRRILPGWILAVASLGALASGAVRFAGDRDLIIAGLTVALVAVSFVIFVAKRGAGTMDGCDTPPEPLDAGPDDSH